MRKLFNSDLYPTVLSIESPFTHIAATRTLFGRFLIKKMIHVDLLSLRSNERVTRVGLAVVKAVLKAAFHFKLMKRQLNKIQEQSEN